MGAAIVAAVISVSFVEVFMSEGCGGRLVRFSNDSWQVLGLAISVRKPTLSVCKRTEITNR
jgi:hypothetical protein